MLTALEVKAFCLSPKQQYRDSDNNGFLETSGKCFSALLCLDHVYKNGKVCKSHSLTQGKIMFYTPFHKSVKFYLRANEIFYPLLLLQHCFTTSVL